MLSTRIHDVSTPQVILSMQSVVFSRMRRIGCVEFKTYVNPMELAVSNSILIHSDRPLMDGVPVHDAARMMTGAYVHIQKFQANNCVLDFGGGVFSDGVRW